MLPCSMGPNSGERDEEFLPEDPGEIIPLIEGHLWLDVKPNGRVHLVMKTLPGPKYTELSMDMELLDGARLPGTKELVRRWVWEFREGLYPKKPSG